MAKSKSTTVAPKSEAPKKDEFANAATLQFPVDRMGITSLLRKEGVRAIGRIKGNKAKLKLVILVLDVLKKHAVARYKAATADHALAMETIGERKARAAKAAEKVRQQSLKTAKLQVQLLEDAAPEAE